VMAQRNGSPWIARARSIWGVKGPGTRCRRRVTGCNRTADRLTSDIDRTGLRRERLPGPPST
jgi:hypothetical protein